MDTTGYNITALTLRFSGRAGQDAVLAAVANLSRLFIGANDFRSTARDMTRYNELSNELNAEFETKMAAIEAEYAERARKLDTAFEKLDLNGYSTQLEEKLIKITAERVEDLVSVKTSQQMEGEDTTKIDELIEKKLVDVASEVESDVVKETIASVPILDIDNEQNLTQKLSTLVKEQTNSGVNKVAQKNSTGDSMMSMVGEMVSKICSKMDQEKRKDFEKEKKKNLKIVQEKQKGKRLGARCVEEINSELKARESTRMVDEMKQRFEELACQRPRNAYAACSDAHYEYTRSDMLIIGRQLLTECQVVEPVNTKTASNVLLNTSLKYLNVVFYDIGNLKWIPLLVVVEPNGRKVILRVTNPKSW